MSKRGIAPCGHPGTYVTNTFISCDRRCEFKDVDFQIVIKTTLECKFCGSYNVDTEFEVDPVFYLFNPGINIVDTRCIDCGKCWAR